ncbi:MAG: hypothetical protein FJ137_15470 [Deltaproteobacteria bacterium]|nr:hypothetical protein [Deltaproteobacteria bacterium]
MRRLALPVVALLWLLPACAEVEFSPPVGLDGAFNSDDAHDGAVVTPGCDPATIVTAGDAVCATCSFAPVDDDAAPRPPSAICGDAVVAPCETRQNSVGAACQLCVTDAGELLYDDCFTADARAPEGRACETSPGDTPGEECRTCFDADGSVVSVGCGPRAESCEDAVVDGRACQVCTADGAVVSSTCAPPDLDPSRCVAFGNELGRCVDCYDDNTLLSHECTDAGAGGTVVCSQTVAPEGLVCTVCTDAAGAVVERACEPALPQPARCADLVYAEQRCVVCVDASDVVVRVECHRNDCDTALACRVDGDCPADLACFDGACVPVAGRGAEEPGAAACPAPPACTNDVDRSGNVCRTCPRDDGVTETRCMPSSRLSCETMPEDRLPDAGASLGEDGERSPEQPSQGRVCTLCRDAPSGVEVYRDCEGNGAVPPPFCFDDVDVGGARCTLCVDAVSGAPVYRSCPLDTCAGMHTDVLVDDGGRPFAFDGPIAQIGRVTCEQCRQGDTVVTEDVVGRFQPRCIVDSPCTNQPADPTQPCPLTTRLVLAPLSCAQPWDGFDESVGEADELRAVLEFLLHGGVFAVSAEQTATATEACDACTCERGDRIAVEVWSYDEERARALLDDVVVP